MPAPRPETFAVAVKELGAVPETGESESHDAVVLTLQVKVPVPELLTVTVWPAGLLPPWTALKAKLVGLKLIVGIWGAVMVKLTITVCGVLVAPVAVTVTGVE